MNRTFGALICQASPPENRRAVTARTAREVGTHPAFQIFALCELPEDTRDARWRFTSPMRSDWLRSHLRDASLPLPLMCTLSRGAHPSHMIRVASWETFESSRLDLPHFWRKKRMALRAGGTNAFASAERDQARRQMRSGSGGRDRQPSPCLSVSSNALTHRRLCPD